jgi:hypothetical protein
MEFMNPFMGMNGVSSPDLLATGLPDFSQAHQSIQPTFSVAPGDLQRHTYASPGGQQLYSSDFRTPDLPSVFPERGAVNLEAFGPVVNSLGNETRSNNESDGQQQQGDSPSLDENGEANGETSRSTKKTDPLAKQPAKSETRNQQESWIYGWDKEPSFEGRICRRSRRGLSNVVAHLKHLCLRSLGFA